jgi:RimJ/RimL family protein N-acetyltransferase
MSAFLTDGVVNLRPVTRADLPQLAAWRNDPELRARTREFRPLTDVDQERWLAKISGRTHATSCSSWSASQA